MSRYLQVTMESAKRVPGDIAPPVQETPLTAEVKGHGIYQGVQRPDGSEWVYDSKAQRSVTTEEIKTSRGEVLGKTANTSIAKPKSFVARLGF